MFLSLVYCTSILVASDFVLACGIGDRVNPGTKMYLVRMRSVRFSRIIRKCGEAAWKSVGGGKGLVWGSEVRILVRWTRGEYGTNILLKAWTRCIFGLRYSFAGQELGLECCVQLHAGKLFVLVLRAHYKTIHPRFPSFVYRSLRHSALPT